MTIKMKAMVKVISLTITAVIISLFLVSLALANRDDRIYPSNYYADGVSVANLNEEQANDLLKEIIPVKMSSLLQLKLPDKIISIPIKDCGVSPDCRTTLSNANVLLNQYQGVHGLINHSVIRGKKHSIKLVYKVNKDLLFSWLTKTIHNKAAVNAHILYDDGLLEYISHQNGYLVNFGATMENICHMLRKGDLGPIKVNAAVIYPPVKLNDIKKVQVVVGAYASLISPQQNEKGSILRIETDKLNGTIIMPDEVFSITGNKYGNTIYPLVQTIYKAMEQAGLKITQPINSMDGNNLYISNNLKTPVLISAIIKDNKLLIKIFGVQTEKGREIHLITEETEVPSKIKILSNTSLQPGQRKVQQEGKNGFVIRTYRVVTKNGCQLEKNLLTKEVHCGTDTIIAVGPNEPSK